MKNPACRGSLFLIAISALLCGCQSSKPFRTNNQIGINPNPTNSNFVIEEKTNYTLGFVEFDDQG
jgi:hypothetical protein